ncbi:MAG: hypothetical protein CM15mP82_5130 [Methanobacteriota archaeon]|nr:MAG: hypothetical protein CM15mP82_5130 [Euryarchaeota archaeon]
MAFLKMLGGHAHHDHHGKGHGDKHGEKPRDKMIP